MLSNERDSKSWFWDISGSVLWDTPISPRDISVSVVEALIFHLIVNFNKFTFRELSYEILEKCLKITVSIYFFVRQLKKIFEEKKKWQKHDGFPVRINTRGFVTWFLFSSALGIVKVSVTNLIMAQAFWVKTFDGLPKTNHHLRT